MIEVIAGASKTEQPTACLRWNEGVLEQMWQLTTANHRGYIAFMDEEWRPVPQVAPNETSSE